MTTITFREDINIKTDFINIKDLYSYIVNNQLLTEIWELSEYEVSNEMINKYKEVKNYTNDMFVNLK